MTPRQARREPDTRWAHLPAGRILHKPACPSLTMDTCHDEPFIVQADDACRWLNAERGRKLCGNCKPSDPDAPAAPSVQTGEQP